MLERFDLAQAADQRFQDGRVHRRARRAAITKEVFAQGADRSHAPFDIAFYIRGDDINRDVNHPLGRNRAELAALAAAATDFNHAHRSRPTARRDFILT